MNLDQLIQGHEVAWLPGILVLPFIGRITGYAINRRAWAEDTAGRGRLTHRRRGEHG